MFLFIFKQVILDKIVHFNCTFWKKFNIVIAGLLHPYPHYIFYQAFFNKLTRILRFLYHFAVCSGIFWHFRILERFEIKGWQNDECLNMYIINTIPHGNCFVRYLRTRFCIRNLRYNLSMYVSLHGHFRLACEQANLEKQSANENEHVGIFSRMLIAHLSSIMWYGSCLVSWMGARSIKALDGQHQNRWCLPFTWPGKLVDARFMVKW